MKVKFYLAESHCIYTQSLFFLNIDSVFCLFYILVNSSVFEKDLFMIGK